VGTSNLANAMCHFLQSGRFWLLDFACKAISAVAGEQGIYLVVGENATQFGANVNQGLCASGLGSVGHEETRSRATISLI